MVEYKKGLDNKVADALSRVSHTQLLMMAVSIVQTDLMDRLQEQWSVDTHLQQIIKEIEENENSYVHYKWRAVQLTRKGRLMVGNSTDLKETIMSWMHCSPQGGHSGIDATTKRIHTLFYWPKLKQSLLHFIRNCNVCQKCKADIQAYPGLLQPLPIPENVWEEVNMDFIEEGKEVIMVVVDRLSKYVHFMALSHPFSAIKVAQVYMDQVYKLHGFPKSIVSDRDKVFISAFWSELMKIHDVQLK